jgi:glycosyltransferase involved in cell wall biosynthesis
VISSFSFAVVLPAHNSAGNICKTIDELTLYFQKNEVDGQVIIVENGSEDDTWEVMKSIDASNLPFELTRTQSEVGLGNAIRKGLESVTSEYVLITADDLPFGFSDIDGYKKIIPDYEIAVGSKAHPDTEGNRSLAREITSAVFRLLRRIIVGVNLGDTQGTIMGKSSVVCPLASQTHQSGYLMTTELLMIATRAGCSIIELPVQFRQDLRKSNINVLGDSLKMLRGLFEVRRRI